MSKVRQAQEFFATADVILTVENTYRPELNGTRRRVYRVGKSYADATLLDDSASYGTLGKVQKAGTDCRISIPTRAADIVAVGEDEVTFRLGRYERLADHTVTLRKVES